jgi:hypothetical protein
MTPEQIAEGRRLNAAVDVEFLAYVATATECGPEHEGHQESLNAFSQANASWAGWITANIAALLDAAEEAERLREEYAKAERLWKAEAIRAERAETVCRGLERGVEILLAAKDAAERELAEAREDSARLDWLDARQPTFAVGRGPSGKWAVFSPANIGGCGYSDVRAAINAERGKR